jgi:hypothetical protein
MQDRPAKSIAEPWGNWLSEYAWDHFVTLTTRDSVSEQRLKMEFVNCFVRRLDQVAQQQTGYFYAVECTTTGHSHLHALTWCGGKLTCEQIKRAWKLGRRQVVPYDPSRRAAYYVTKTIGDASYDHYGISKRLPPKLDPMTETSSLYESHSTPKTSLLLSA